MSKLKIFACVEAVVIIVLAIMLFHSYGNNEKQQHCAKYLNDDGTVCLLSPRVYTGMIEPENMLILNFKPLQDDIQNYISQSKANISVYVLNIRDGASFGIGEDTSYEAFSMNKIPLAIIILKKVEEGALSLDTVLPIEEEDKDSGSGTLYSKQINGLPVRDLIYHMLAESDNTATITLERQATLSNLGTVSDYLDYYTENPITFYEKNYNQNFAITPKSTANAFLSLYLSTILRPEDSSKILSYMTNTSFDIKKYAQLPDDVVVAQKYGASFSNGSSYFHTCGIIYIKESRIFYCVMTKGLEAIEIPKVTGSIVNKIYVFVVASKKTNENKLKISS